MGRVPGDATAFAHRDASIMTAVIAHVTEDHAATTAWTEAYAAELAGNATGVYSNFLAEEGDARAAPGLPGGHLRAARRGQAPRRPGERVPRQPQHPALGPGRAHGPERPERRRRGAPAPPGASSAPGGSPAGGVSVPPAASPRTRTPVA